VVSTKYGLYIVGRLGSLEVWIMHHNLEFSGNLESITIIMILKYRSKYYVRKKNKEQITFNNHVYSNNNMAFTMINYINYIYSNIISTFHSCLE